LEWSTKARYTGEFLNGLYHGEGMFEWPDKAHVYRGQWAFGQMSGKGTLTTSNGSIYSGEFHAGHLEGRGAITFVTNDQYVGEFKDSMFNGLGTYTWSSGTTLVGRFENNFCNEVGKKSYPNGLVYVGELAKDQEDGKGVVTAPDGTRIVGLWSEGKLVNELVEMIVPASEVDASAADLVQEQRVFVSNREPNLPAPQLSSDAPGGVCLMLYASGDKYIGGVNDGTRTGDGMYVYANSTAYKGVWQQGVLEGQEHPRPREELSEEVQRLNDMNERNTDAIFAMKQRMSTEKKQLPPVYRLPQ
jgi:hypothetical protein